jgi:hypothetical protein
METKRLLTTSFFFISQFTHFETKKNNSLLENDQAWYQKQRINVQSCAEAGEGKKALPYRGL